MSDDKKTVDPNPAYKPTQIFRCVKDVMLEQERVMAEAKAFYDRAEDDNRALDQAELAEAERLMDYHKRLEETEKPNALKYEEMVAKAASAMPAQLLASHNESQPAPAIPNREYDSLPDVIPTKLKAFRKESFGGDPRKAYKAAEEAGHFLRATLCGDAKSIRWCNSREHLRKLVPNSPYMDNGQHTGAFAGAETGDLTKGGYLVPEAVAAMVLDVRDRVGAIAQICRVYPMMEETDHVPKRVDGLTVQKPDETAPIVETQKTFGQVSLVARDAWTLTYVSTRLMRGAVVDAADQVINEIGYAFAKQQDYEGFNGSGAAGSPNWGIDGIVPNIGAAGIVPATGATDFSTITADHINALIGALPDRFHTRSAGASDSLADGRPVFVCSHAFWAATFARIQAAGGGNTMQSLSQDVPFSYLGYPIVMTDQLPTTYGASTTSLLFGNFYEACLLGQRAAVNVSLSDHHRFAYGQLSIRGQIAYDFKFHETGDVTDAGGVVGLQTPA